MNGFLWMSTETVIKKIMFLLFSAYAFLPSDPASHKRIIFRTLRDQKVVNVH